MKIQAIKVVKPTVNRITKPKLNSNIADGLKEITNPIISNLKAYYSSAEEKLNDILIERTRNKLSTSVVEYNINEFKYVPEAFKNIIKPHDISREGHISQSRINELWEAAIKAKEPGVYGRAPVFRGLTNEMEMKADVPQLANLDMDAAPLADMPVEPPVMKLPNLEMVSDLPEPDVSAEALEQDLDDLAQTAAETAIEAKKQSLKIIKDIIDFFG